VLERREERRAVEPVEVAIKGEGLVADPDGALWWPEESALVVADLHLEKASSLARRGALLPPYDTAATLGSLAKLVMAYDPRLVLALGDSFHDQDGASRLDSTARRVLQKLMAGRDWIWLAGNHDPEPPVGLGGECLRSLELGPFLFRHEPALGPVSGEIAGHLHPVARIRVRGRSIRRRCFATDGKRLILPAFGALAGGLNVLDQAFRTLFSPGLLAALVMGETRTYSVAPAYLVGD
jgi:uncharacterized protein